MLLFEDAGRRVDEVLEEAGNRINDVAAQANELADQAWSDLAVEDKMDQASQTANELSDAAWSAATEAADDVSEVAENVVDETPEVVRDAAYVNMMAYIGAARTAEDAARAAAATAVKAAGDSETAAEIASGSFADELSDSLGETLKVSDAAKQAGEVAETAGEIAGGVAVAATVIALAPEGAVATGALAAVDAAFALDLSEDVLKDAASDGDISNEEVMVAVGAGAASAAIGAGAGKVISGLGKALETAGGSMARTLSETGAGKAVIEAGESVVKHAEAGASELAEQFTSLSKELLSEASKKLDPEMSNFVRDLVVDNAERNGVTVWNEVTRNRELVNKVHPETGVQFVRRTFFQESGKLVDGVFAKFDSSFDAKISSELYEATNAEQFKECNKQLAEAIEKNSELKSKFSKEQIEQIIDGITDGGAPDGYVWHHNEEEGVIQLVDAETHVKTGHTGGNKVWGNNQ